ISQEELFGKTLHVIDAEVYPEEQWVTISGTAAIKDQLTKKMIPLQGIEVLVKNEIGEVQDKALTDNKGHYELGMNPGDYFIEISNASKLGYAEMTPRLFTARNNKENVYIKLSLPKPILKYHSEKVAVIEALSDHPTDKLAIVSNGK